uniref:Calcium-binding protein PBP1 n=1 Tax=Anthurium amnicola TaxID=1678845 RepID=A0A1D1YWY3_9ARAE
MASDRAVTAQVEPLLGGEDFEDYLPVMAEKLGGEGLLEELCAGFQLLADPERGLITFESLKRNAAALGLEGLSEVELLGMLREGDMDGDGALDQMEFCVLMFRLSPELMEESRHVVGEALQHELVTGTGFFFS